MGDFHAFWLKVLLFVSVLLSMADHKQGYHCMVTRLPLSLTTEHLKANFSQFGKILDAKVLMDNFNDVTMGLAFITFEEESARSAAMKWSGKLFCGNIIGVYDDGFGMDASEFQDSPFDAYVSIGQTRKRGPGGGLSLHRGMIHPREGNADAGSLEGSAKNRLNDCP